MALGKWIGGVFGAFAAGPIGAILGFFLGSLVDRMNEKTDVESNQYQTYSGQSSSRNGFLFSMMLLMAHMIQADGKIMHSEMEYVRRWLKQNFGDDAMREGESILNRLFEYRRLYGEQAWSQQIYSCCAQIATIMPAEQRFQLVSILAEIAKADGNVVDAEVQALKQMAVAMRLDVHVVDQFLSLGGDSLDDAYKVLGITPDATDDEVRKAYRKMALQYHPDRVATLGEDVKENAKRRFQEINAAKENIYKVRHM